MSSLSIIIPSFNREAYIAQALDSIFMQESSYDYKIIVCDDASSDKTLEIAKQYKDKYGKMTILESSTNQKLYINVRRGYSMIDSEYFCVLDPDDYWTDKHKIQKALDFLETHKDYTIYTGNTNVVDSTTQTPYIGYNTTKTCSFNDYLNSCAIAAHTSSAIFRNVVFNGGGGGAMPYKLMHLENPTCERSFRGDSFRNIVHLHEGKQYYSCEIDSVYRLHENGIWTSMQMFKRAIASSVFLRDMWQYYDKKYFNLLLLSYKSYKGTLNSEYMHALFTNNDFSLWADMLQDVALCYVPYMDTLDTTLKDFLDKRMKLKYKIFSNIHNKLEQKLSKKGFIL